jgi:hypothetical protein
MKRRRVEQVSYGPRGGEKQLERGGKEVSVAGGRQGVAVSFVLAAIVNKAKLK